MVASKPHGHDDAAAAAEAPLTWTSQVAFDPGLIERLVAANDRLRSRFANLVKAVAGRDRSLIADAAIGCVDELRLLNRTEAMRLYPVIARGFGGDTAALSAFTQRRLSVYGHGRRLLRFLEAVAKRADGLVPDALALRAAAQHLERYVAEKQAKLYTLYLFNGRGPAHVA